MQNLINPEQKASYEAAFDSIHESFGREVTIIKEPKRTVVVQNSNSFNYFYSQDGQGALTEVIVPVSGVFKMRIKWEDPSQELSSSEPGLDIVRPKIHANLCRLKMRQDAYAFLNGSKEFLVDDKRCEWVGFSKPHGIISNNFYTIILREVN